MCTNIAYMKTNPHMHLIHVQTKLSHKPSTLQHCIITCETHAYMWAIMAFPRGTYSIKQFPLVLLPVSLMCCFWNGSAVLYVTTLCLHVTQSNSRLFPPFWYLPWHTKTKRYLARVCVLYIRMCGDFVEVLPHCLLLSFASLGHQCFPHSSARL